MYLYLYIYRYLYLCHLYLYPIGLFLCKKLTNKFNNSTFGNIHQGNGLKQKILNEERCLLQHHLYSFSPRKSKEILKV